MHKRLGLTVIATLALAGSMAAQADTQPGFYVGAGIGTTKVSDNSFDGTGIDDSDTGFKIFGGYDFNPNIAVEVSYLDLGEASASDAGGSLSVGVTALTAAAVGRLPLSDMFALYGKLGYASYDVKAHVNIVGFGSGSGSDSNSDLFYGVGGALSFGGNFEGRLEYEAINVDGGDLNMISLGGVYRFR